MNVHQKGVHLTDGPDPKKPYFRKRYVFPTPPDNSPSEEIRAVGLNHIFRHHHHSPALTVCPNGDLLYSIYSSYKEYDAEVGIAGTRLRKGCDEWEQPDIFVNPVGVNDHAPNLYTDKDGTIYHFWGWQQLTDSFPFQYIYSTDNGETWSKVTLLDVPNNNSGTDAVTMKDGRHVLIYNDFSTLPGTPKGPRTPLCVAVSDDGIHWKNVMTLEDSPISQYSYPSIIQGKDGKLHAVYTWRRQRVAYKELDLSKLK